MASSDFHTQYGLLPFVHISFCCSPKLNEQTASLYAQNGYRDPSNADTVLLPAQAVSSSGA